jgi:hypothetical protein
LITFSFSQSNEIQPSSSDQAVYDKLFQAKMESIRAVYLASVINHLLIYFLTGSIMAAIQEAVVKFSGPTKASQLLTQLDITLTSPNIIIPKSQLSNDKLIGNLGMIRITNKLDDSNCFEVITVAMDDMNLTTNLSGQNTHVVDKLDMDLHVKRNLFLKPIQAPDVTVSMDIPDISLNMSHIQYQMIWEIIEDNILAGGGFVPSQVEFPTNDNVLETVEQDATVVAIHLAKFNLTVLRHEGNPLAQLNMYGLGIQVNKLKSGKTIVQVVLKEIDAHDLRAESQSQFKNIIDTRPTNQTETVSDDENFVSVTVVTDINTNETNVKVIAGKPRIIFEPGVVMEMVQFGMKRFPDGHSSLQYRTQQQQQVNRQQQQQQQKTTKVQVQVGGPSLVIPVNALEKDTRLLVVKFGAQFSMEMRPATGYQSFHVGVVDLMAYMEHPKAIIDNVAPILEPIAVALHIEIFADELDANKIDTKIAASVLSTIKARVAYQDIKNITDIIKEFIDKNKLISASKEKIKELVVKYDTTGQFNLGSYFDDDDERAKSALKSPITVESDTPKVYLTILLYS